MSLNSIKNSNLIEHCEVLDALPVLVFLERAGKIVFANAEARQMLGLEEEAEWAPCPVEDVLWGLFAGTAEPQTLLTASKKGSPFHATMPTADGSLQPVEGTYCLLNAEDREAVIVAHPGGRGQAPKPGLMEDVLASLPEAVAIVHDNHVLYTNAGFSRMFGYSAEEASGGNLAELIVPETRRNEYALFEKTVDQNGRALIETVRMNKAGELLDVGMLAGPLMVDGARLGYVFTYRDIGERKQTEKRLQFDAMHDMLTELPNRALFLDRLTLALSRRQRRHDQTCGVLFIDLDHFKELNDTLGHAAGDVLLKAVAERLRAALRPHDSASRLGGDEFAVLVENIHSIADLEVVARRVSDEMQRPIDVFRHKIQAGASIGVAMAGPDHTAPELLIRDADFAMYAAKQAGGGRYEIFDKHMQGYATAQQERERELRCALQERQVEVWYQPIYRLQTGKLEGFESLLRWRRTNGSVDSFKELLPVAEETGLSISLGREMVEAVSKQLRRWTGDLLRADLTVGINVTERQFYHPDMVAQLRATLQSSGVNPMRLMFEISESTLNENPDAAVAILQRMVDCGVRIAVDHFGSSLAPINLLVRLPIDTLKLAPQLTAAADYTGRQQAVLESLVRLGHTLGMQVVAQGIESAEQLEALRRMGCELGQGKQLSSPLEAARATELMGLGHWAMAPSV